jgi:hypothetical protein
VCVSATERKPDRAITELLSELVEMSRRLEPERGERSDVTSLLH